MQKETLEEVAERLYLSYENNELLYGHSEDLQLAYKAGIFEGAEWQQERMFELVEEYNQMLVDPNVHEDHKEKSFKEWFKQFKKK